MKEIFKFSFKILLLILFAVTVMILLLTAFFSDEIEKSVINKIQENIEAPLVLDDVDFTIYENFPSASVKITNLLVFESKEFNYDTLLFTKRAYVNISLLDIINKNYTLQDIIITDAKINVKYNDQGIPNFLIFKKPVNTKSIISINKIVLLNSELNITKKTPILDMSWLLKRSIILINDKKYRFNTDGFSNKLVVGSIDYMHDKKVNFLANTRIVKDTITIVESDFEVEDLMFNAKGDILNGNTLNLEIEGKNQDVNNIIMHLPENIRQICSPVIANGKITFHSVLKGLVNKKRNPFFEMHYQLIEGGLKLKSNPFELNNIQMNGYANNGVDMNFISTRIVAHLFKAKTNNGDINGEFMLSNLNRYFLETMFSSSWDLKEVNQYFEDSPFFGLKGRLYTNTSYKGGISFDNKFKRMFLNARHKSDLKIRNIEFDYKALPIRFSLLSAEMKVNKEKILINSCESTISETDFNFQGQISNLIGYIFDEASKIYIQGDIKSTYTNFSQLLGLAESPQSEGADQRKTIMPDWVNVNTTLDIKNFSYKKFIASDLSGVLRYNDREINANSLDARSLNGKISGGFSLTEFRSNNLKLTSNIQLNKINIRNSFAAFNNYGQEVIINKQLKGVGTAKLNIESYWTPNFVLDKKRLKVKSHLVIEKGELIDFKPLENLSSYVSLEELKHVKFSTLENTIDIENEVITIPTMEIKSSALSVFLSGTHTFDQEINYDIKLLLSELMSTSFRRKNTKITKFGEEQQDGEIFNTVYFKMTGNTNDPKISLDKIRFMEDVNNTIKKEKETIVNIIKEDILQKEEIEEKEEGQDIEIEWDPEL